jgi:addiction module HigA family antidote
MLPKHRPTTHPGEMLLKEFLEPAGVSQADAAKRIGVPFQRLNAIVRGRRAVSADTAIRLEALTRMDAVFWLRLQADWDLWHALRAPRGRPRQFVPRPRARDATTSTPVASYTGGSRASRASESRDTSSDLAKRSSREPSRARERVEGLGTKPPGSVTASELSERASRTKARLG